MLDFLFNSIKLEVVANALHTSIALTFDIYEAKVGGESPQSQPGLHSEILSQEEESKKKEEKDRL